MPSRVLSAVSLSSIREQYLEFKKLLIFWVAANQQRIRSVSQA